MTFVFETLSSVPSEEFIYVNAPDLNSAIDIFESRYGFLKSDVYHIYVRIV